MKAKILSIITIALAGVMSSCNMDLKPEGYLEEHDALTTVGRAERFRNSFYTGMRSFTSSQYFTYPEIQADNFNGLVINGNRMGDIANGTVLSSDENITGYWAALYSIIGNINFFLEHVQPLYDQLTEANDVEQLQKLNHYIGEAHFFRGYYYACLFDRWCQKYSPELGDKPGLGLPIVTVFNPTEDRSSYPGRSTMNETIKFFQDEIELGRKAIMEYEEVDDSNLKPMASYISHYAIDAMQARIALWLGDYDTAISKSKSIIDSKKFAMCNTDAYPNLWLSDVGSEIIFMPFESTSELGNAIGAAWISSIETQADYAPSPSLLVSLTSKNKTAAGKGVGDVRSNVFVDIQELATGYGKIKTPCFTKFPGNEALNAVPEVNSLINKPKPFRISEQYLILAEASFEKGDETTANEVMELFYQNRYTGVTSKYTALTGNSLRDEIRTQRNNELVGEGFRISDLRRWGLGFTRSSDYTVVRNLSGFNKKDVGTIMTPAGLEVVYTPDDHRYTWPIPSSELEVNPQMKGQQNPGY